MQNTTMVMTERNFDLTPKIVPQSGMSNFFLCSPELNEFSCDFLEKMKKGMEQSG
jgi:hypothetical protein